MSPSHRSSGRPSTKRHTPSRRGNPRKRAMNRKARRVAVFAFSPAMMVAALVLCGIALTVWSCSSFDPAPSRRRTVANTETPAMPAAVMVPAAPLYPDEPDIRVRIKQAVDTARIDGPAVLMLSAQGMRPTPISAPVTIASGPGGVRFDPQAGDSLQYPAGITVTVQPSGNASGNTTPTTTITITPPAHAAILQMDGIQYPGTLIIRPASDVGPNRFDVIADMSIEDYLPGVLAKELFPKWPLAAYEAQAVCARTYALFVRDLDRAAGHFFDVENTQSDQVFGGATTNQTALTAVRNTRGAVLTYQGKPFKAYYSSTCGGRAGSAADVWPIGKGFEYNLAPPIQGTVHDHYCQQARLYRWEVIRSTEDLSRRIAAWGKNSGHQVRAIGLVTSISPEKLNATGRPARYFVGDDRGRVFSLSGEELRVACNVGAEGLPAITPQTRVNSNDLEVTPSPVGTSPGFIIRGRGFGHGVGMCQWCLKGLADRGVPWDQQVLIFYPGAGITKAYQ